MILQDVGMLLAPTNRTLCYLRAMLGSDLLPAWVLYLDDGAAPRRPVDVRSPEAVPALLTGHGIPFVHLALRDPNAPAAVAAVAACPTGVLVYSGPSGGILRAPLLATGKRFLHIHPGRLPEYRGSTTIYYALLRGEPCGVSAFFLDRGIDTGDVIGSRVVPPPADRTRIDLEFDPELRAGLLVELLREYARSGRFTAVPQPAAGGETYHIIHPVLKHLAVLGKS